MVKATQAAQGGVDIEKALNDHSPLDETPKPEGDHDILLYSEEPKAGLFRRRLSSVTEARMVEIENDMVDEDDVEPQPFTQ